jgi:hypothetical protein
MFVICHSHRCPQNMQTSLRIDVFPKRRATQLMRYSYVSTWNCCWNTRTSSAIITDSVSCYATISRDCQMLKTFVSNSCCELCIAYCLGIIPRKFLQRFGRREQTLCWLHRLLGDIAHVTVCAARYLFCGSICDQLHSRSMSHSEHRYTNSSTNLM